MAKKQKEEGWGGGIFSGPEPDHHLGLLDEFERISKKLKKKKR